jgi:pimeloyl-ACP methyl ester carboxylesterase
MNSTVKQRETGWHGVPLPAGILAAGMALLLIGPLATAKSAAPVLDPASVPYLDQKGKDSYADFLLMNLPRAFALASNGLSGWYGGGGTIEDARSRALSSCTQKGGVGCAIYAEDLQVVWRGAAPVTLPQGPPSLVASGMRGFSLLPDARFFWYGPAQARGILVWAHGKSAQYKDARGEQPQQYVRAFNNAGYDVVRFDRAPTDDYVAQAADFLRDGLKKLREMGWRSVVAAGQSRGAWNSLQMLDTTGLVDAVIAISPANRGDYNSPTRQETDLKFILDAARSPATRVAVAEFEGDDFVPDLAGRIATLHELAPPRVGALMIIDRPEGITGHGGGASPVFARRFGRCLVRFVTEPVPLKTCG